MNIALGCMMDYLNHLPMLTEEQESLLSIIDKAIDAEALEQYKETNS
jgi:hypothetical protein